MFIIPAVFSAQLKKIHTQLTDQLTANAAAAQAKVKNEHLLLNAADEWVAAKSLKRPHAAAPRPNSPMFNAAAQKPIFPAKPWMQQRWSGVRVGPLNPNLGSLQNVHTVATRHPTHPTRPYTGHPLHPHQETSPEYWVPSGTGEQSTRLEPTQNNWFTVRSAEPMEQTTHNHQSLPSTNTCTYTFMRYNAGSITSPGFPGKYANGDCIIYNLVASQTNFMEKGKVKLVFNVFETERNFDFVSIYAGNSADERNLLIRLSGVHQSIAPIYAPSNIVTVKFTADQGMTAKGFSANFVTYTDDQMHGNFDLNGFVGVLTSPDYPAPVPMQPKDVFYHIKSPILGPIQLQIKNFYLSPEDSVTVYDGFYRRPSEPHGHEQGNNLRSIKLTGELKNLWMTNVVGKNNTMTVRIQVGNGLGIPSWKFRAFFAQAISPKQEQEHEHNSPSNERLWTSIFVITGAAIALTLAMCCVVHKCFGRRSAVRRMRQNRQASISIVQQGINHANSGHYGRNLPLNAPEMYPKLDKVPILG